MEKNRKSKSQAKEDEIFFSSSTQKYIWIFNLRMGFIALFSFFVVAFVEWFNMLRRKIYSNNRKPAAAVAHWWNTKWAILTHVLLRFQSTEVTKNHLLFFYTCVCVCRFFSFSRLFLDRRWITAFYLVFPFLRKPPSIALIPLLFSFSLVHRCETKRFNNLNSLQTT